MSFAMLSIGGVNQAAPLGDRTRLRINEWLALGTTPFDTDFVELYNPDSLPVALGGLYMSDEIIGWPDRHQIAPDQIHRRTIELNVAR